MKSATARTAALAALCMLLPVAAPAAEEPEAVYAKYHRAAASGDLAEMGKYEPEARRAELAAMSAAQKDASVKMLAATMPRAFSLRDKRMNPDGRSARLVVSGQGTDIVDGKLEMLYGTIRMAMERGEWKVEETRWNSEPPGNLAPARPAGSPAADKAAPKAAAKAQGAPVVGATSAAPMRKLGAVKPPCVYKPVMSAEDVENCR